MKEIIPKIDKKLSKIGEFGMTKREIVIAKEIYKAVIDEVSAGGEKIWVWRR